jgi:hypothetical protein
MRLLHTAGVRSVDALQKIAVNGQPIKKEMLTDSRDQALVTTSSASKATDSFVKNKAAATTQIYIKQ